jgi:acyl-CoA thioesterase-1
MILLSALSVALFTSALFVTAPLPAAARPRIVALGDSLTSGHGIGSHRAFPAVLQKRLDEQGYEFAVHNAGVSGDTSARALQRSHAALQGDVRVLIVALGANDGLRGMPVEQLRRNLAGIIEAAQAKRIDVLLCGMESLPIHGWNYSVAFHKAYTDIARTYDVPLVPFMMMRVLADPALILPDRVHPNADGARVMADHVWPYLDALLQKRGYLPSASGT